MPGEGLILGFTGSREGLTDRQHMALRYLLFMSKRLSSELHHGMCVGGDWIAACLAIEYGYVVVAHPCDIRTMQFLSTVDDSQQVLPEKPPLERNHDIVDACDLLIAASRSLQEEQRSGTWATVRYARKQGKPVIVLDP